MSHSSNLRKHRIYVPIDLIQSIAECLLGDSPTLLSFCLANKICYRQLLPLLYREVHLSNLRSIDQFCYAILNSQPGLGKYATSVHFEPSNPSDDSLHGLTDAIQDALCQMPGLLELTVHVDLVAIAPILRCLELHRPFSLRRLSCSFCQAKDLLPFLSTQSSLEYFTIFEPHPFWRPWFICSPPADILPNLKYISSNPLNLYALLPGRPITGVGSGAVPLSGVALRFFCQCLKTSTATTGIESVEVSLPLNDFWGAESEFTTKLADACGSSLRELRIKMADMFVQPATVSNDIKLLYGQEPTYLEV